MGVGRSSSLRTTADRSPLHDVRQPASRDRGSTRYKFKFMDDARSRLTRIGGARRDRTDDLLLAKQALSQLSYGPVSSAGLPIEARGYRPSLRPSGYGGQSSLTSRAKIGGPGK